MSAPEALEVLPLGTLCAVHANDEARFTCVRCGTFGCEACLFSSAAQDPVCRACASGGLDDLVPWERRRELGLWRAFWQTTSLACRQPTAFFRTPRGERGVIWPVVYGAAAYTVGQALYYLLMVLVLLAGGGVTAALAPGDEGSAIGGIISAYGCVLLGMSPLVLLQAPVQAILGIMVAAAASHGILSIGKKTRGSFEETLRAVSFANAPLTWFFVPCAGLFTYWWMCGVETIAIRETHKCGTDRAVLATIGYRLVLGVLLVGGYVGFIALMVALTPQRGG
ncbi:MAG: hypothetical protein IT378_03030 [Sandaracinaceae bacterium]|nr:hypothetical protein [Sandaracinaceae bacterium]